MSGGDFSPRFRYNARKKGAAKMTATVNGQSITITDETLTVSESVGIYECDFTFDASWSGWNKTAVFEGAGETIEMIVVDNKAQIPWEVLKEAGWIKIGVYGTSGGEIKPTVWSDQIYVAAGTVPGSVTVTPTPSTYAQILDLANGAKSTAEGVEAEWEAVTASASTLTPGSPATVTFEDNNFAFGIPQGAKGDTGATPEFSIGTVSTLETGQSATATITGTAAAPVLNLGLPKGNTGSQGIPGDVANIAATYSTSATYAVGDYCIYSSQLYRCTTAITTAEAWTAAHCEAVQLGDDVSTLRSALNDIIDVSPDIKTANKNSDVFTTYATAGYLSYTDGHFSSDADYTILLLTFNESSSVSIVKNNESGICGAVLYSEELETIPTSSSAARNYYVRGARSDKVDYPLPTAGSPWQITAGQMLAVFLRINPYTTNDFTMTWNEGEITKLDNNIKFNTSQISDIREYATVRPVIKYGAVDTDIGSRGKEQITVFIPTFGGYIKYAFVRCEYDAYNANSWRIDRCYYCNANKEVQYPITNKGEWEMAIEISGAPDFIGGNAHGDEVLVAFKVLIDGVAVDDVTSIAEQEFDVVRMIETTLLYDPNDEATLSTRDQYTPVGTHGREYIIDKDGIRLTQEVTLDEALTLGSSYMTMFPIIRGNDAISVDQITDHYYANNNYIVYDVSVGGSGDGYGWKPNVTRATIYGEDSGVSATLEMLKQPEVDNAGARMFQVQSTVDMYNKIYWSICGVNNNPYLASANERFVTDTLYKVSVK